MGDEVSFLVWESGEEFAKARLLDIKESNLGGLTEEDWEGHEKFETDENMYITYSEYYNCEVNKDSLIKIIKFKLI